MTVLKHEFVKTIPQAIDDGKLYISVEYCTAIHKCCCGCGNEVVTPFSPTDWKFTYDGESVSLYPSIGNWNFECKSHYWINNNEIEWASKWTQREIESGRKFDSHNKQTYFHQKNNHTGDPKKADGFWVKIKEWFLK